MVRDASTSIGATPARRRSPWPAVTGVLVAATVVVASGLGGESTSIAITDVAAVATALTGAALALRAGRRAAEGGVAWTLLGLALGAWGLGEVLWGVKEVILGDEVPFPSIADVAYLAAIPFAVAGVLAFARGGNARFRVRTVLDGCLVSGSLLFLSWALVLGPVWRTDASSTWEHIISVAYPATDLVLAVLALAIVQWGDTAERAALRMVAAALLVMAATDMAFTWLTTNGTFSSSNPIAMLWPASYLMLAYATTMRGRAVGETVPEDVRVGSLVTPYIPLLGAIAVAAPRVLGGHPLGPFLTINGSVLVGVVLVRQALTAWDLRTSVSALHARERELERLALEDPLTGLANRARFAARLEAVLAVPGAEPAVVYIDLDGFKQVNDRFGHAAGDELLVEVAKRLQACMDRSMLLARLGGDEFVVLVELGHDRAVEVAREILGTFELPFRSGGEAVPFHASLGIASAPIGGSPDEAVRRADAAMYVAKTSGKGRAVDYPDEDLLVGRPVAS